LDNIDPAIRRSGRLDYEIEIPVPNTSMREAILSKMLSEFAAIGPSNIKELAKITHGFVGADLETLISKSSKRELESERLSLIYDDILTNLSTVKPSAMRELLIEKPNVKWSDIGGMHDLKLKLKQIVEWPLLHPETFKRLGIKPPRGLCMFGPPGCSKTMIAKALASESNLNFISIKGSDLFSMWVGESEKAVRDLFVKARQLAPCIVFFDEIDAIGGERESGSSVKERVLAQILTEIDGVNTLKNVIIIAATNRPDLIDTALMRPGRLDRIVYVQLPDAETREEIFKIKLFKIPIASDVDVKELVRRTEGYSGAEIEAVCKEAALKALEDSFDIQEIAMNYFDKALSIVSPRTSPELLQLYSEYEKRK
jgi:AAA family ATPase